VHADTTADAKSSGMTGLFFMPQFWLVIAQIATPANAHDAQAHEFVVFVVT
jgi:hypothetical protein